MCLCKLTRQNLDASSMSGWNWQLLLKGQHDHDNLLFFLCELCKILSLSIYIDVMSEHIACINTYYQVWFVLCTILVISIYTCYIFRHGIDIDGRERLLQSSHRKQIKLSWSSCLLIVAVNFNHSWNWHPDFDVLACTSTWFSTFYYERIQISH